MSVMEWVAGLFSPNDPELVKKTVTILVEQDKWNDVFSTKLIELLDKIDNIREDIHEGLQKADERIAKAESVTQAETMLIQKTNECGEASERLQRAEAAEKRAADSAREARQQLESATELAEKARGIADEARGQSEFASKQFRTAQEAELRAIQFARRATRFSVVAIVLSWIAMIWVICVVFHVRPFLWTPIGLSILVSVLAASFVRSTQGESRV